MPGAGLRSPCRPQLPLMARRIGIGALAGRRTVTAAEFVVVVVVARAELPAGAQRTGEFEIDAVADDVRIAELETAVRIVVVDADEVRIVALTEVIQRKRCVEQSVAGMELEAGIVVTAERGRAWSREQVYLY